MRILRRGSRLDRWRRLLRRRLRSLTLAPGAIETALERFAREREHVVFVQIGSNDGRSNDPLYRLATRHRWAGVLVEPVPYLVERLRQNYSAHPQIRIEHAAIADAGGMRDFWHVNPADPMHRLYDQIGSFDRQHVVRHVSKYDKNLEGLVISRQVPCLTLAELLSKHEIESVDLLHIDAEGFDGVILRSIDFGTLRPELILFEHAHLLDAERNACTALLEQHGYTLVVEDSDTLAVSTLPVPGDGAESLTPRRAAHRSAS